MVSEIFKNAKTVDVIGEPWVSPDGKVSIWQVKLEIDGSQDLVSTMSKAIATVGFQGDVEAYMNAKGKTYYRQAPKEEQSAPSEPVHEPEQAKPTEAYWQDKQAQIRAQFAIKAAIQYAVNPAQDDLVDMQALEGFAIEFFAMVDRVKVGVEEQSGYDKAQQVNEELKAKQLARTLDNGEPLPEYQGDYSEYN